jgi:hypothetical protein
MKRYAVTIPAAGHVHVEVLADNAKDAIKKALETEIPKDPNIEWETLEAFNNGNVCRCPSPWQVEAELLDEEGEA